MTDRMSPDASPGSASRGSGVRRVNNLPLWIIVGGILIFLITMALVASNRAAQQHQVPTPVAGKGGDSSIQARQVAGIQEKGGIVAPSEPGKLEVPTDAPLPAASPSSVRAPASARPPLAPTPVQRSPYDEELARIRQGRLQSLAQGARAKTAVAVPVERSIPAAAVGGRAPVGGGAPSAPPDVDPRAAYQARVAQLQAAGAGASGNLGASNPMAQFGNPGGDRWALNSRPEPPRTRFELRAGFVIPALLMSGINSDLPGQIMAQVSENVFDTPTGKYVLIPQGSRLVGTYSSEMKYGQARVLIAWQRIVFPDGQAMDIGAMPGADGAGYAGFSDKVNNHYVRLFGSAILLSAVTAGIAYSQNNTQQAGAGYNTQPTFGSAMSEALGQQFGQVTGQLLAKNLNISPTLEIRPGYRFNVMVTKDLTFNKPYQSLVR